MSLSGRRDRSALARKAPARPSASSSPARSTCPSTLAAIRAGNFEDDWTELAGRRLGVRGGGRGPGDQAPALLQGRPRGEEDGHRHLQHLGPRHRGHVVASAGGAPSALPGHPLLQPAPLPEAPGDDPRPRDRAPRARRHRGLLRPACSARASSAARTRPNFIGNRIGSYGFGAALQAMQELDLTIEEVDALTGPAIGRAQERHLPHRGHRGRGRLRQGRHQPLRRGAERPRARALPRPRLHEDRWSSGSGWARRRGSASTRRTARRSGPSTGRRSSTANGGRRSSPRWRPRSRWPTSGPGCNQILAGNDKAAQFLWPCARLDLPLRRQPRPRDLGRRGLGGSRDGVGLRLGPGPVPAHGRARSGGGGRAWPGRRASGPAARREAPGLGPEALLRDGRRTDHRLRRGRPGADTRPAGRRRARRPRGARRRAQEEPGSQPPRPGRRLWASSSSTPR